MEIMKKILIITSDNKLRDVLNFCFHGWGYEVFLQDNLTPDINFIKRISPDVIIVDVQAARKSQLEICQIIKSDFATALIPIITVIERRQLRQQLFNIRQGILLDLGAVSRAYDDIQGFILHHHDRGAIVVYQAG